MKIVCRWYIMTYEVLLADVSMKNKFYDEYVFGAKNENFFITHIQYIFRTYIFFRANYSHCT